MLAAPSTHADDDTSDKRFISTPTLPKPSIMRFTVRMMPFVTLVNTSCTACAIVMNAFCTVAGTRWKAPAITSLAPPAALAIEVRISLQPHCTVSQFRMRLRPKPAMALMRSPMKATAVRVYS